MDDTWWVCESCTSLNRRRARKCYSCGTMMDGRAPAEVHEPFSGMTIVRVVKPDDQPVDSARAPVHREPGSEWSSPKPVVERWAPEPVLTAPAGPGPATMPALVAAERPFGRLSRVWVLVALAAVICFWVAAALPRA